MFLLIVAIQFERDSIGSPKKWKETPSPCVGSTASGMLDGTVGVNMDNSEDKYAGGNSERLHSNGSNNGNGNSSNAERGVICRLMEMETHVNNEMSARYRSSVITSSRSTASTLEGLGTAGEIGTGTSTIFPQPYRPCTVDDLNDISRTTLLLMVGFFIIVNRNALIFLII